MITLAAMLCKLDGNTSYVDKYWEIITTWADYLVENGGRIVFVGNELPEKYRRAETVELGGRALIPPFADTHQHFASLPIPMNSRATGCLISRSRS